MQFLACIIFIILLNSPFAVKSEPMQSGCGDLKSKILKKDMPCLLKELIDHSFPQLQLAYYQSRITFEGLDTPSYFLKTWQHTGVFAGDKSKRTYTIRVNPKLFSALPSPPSRLAVQGILAHELFHIVDYETTYAGGFVLNQLQELVTNRKYERYTDLRTLEIGYAEGLKQYRIWIYTQLSGSALLLKKWRYYTPEEIDDWVSALARTSQSL